MQTPHEEDKSIPFAKEFSTKHGKAHPFSTLHSHIPPCCKRMSPLAEAEWKLVKTEQEAKIWHLKWTPWLLPECIDGIIKYHYLKLICHTPDRKSSEMEIPVEAPPNLATKENPVSSSSKHLLSSIPSVLIAEPNNPSKKKKEE